MKGYLTQTSGEWMVRYSEDDKVYPLCVTSRLWSEKNVTQKFLKEGVEVVFDFIVKGEYCETKEEITKNYYAIIKRVEHESIKND
jgi:hypothetical protein